MRSLRRNPLSLGRGGCQHYESRYAPRRRHQINSGDRTEGGTLSEFPLVQIAVWQPQSSKSSCYPGS